MIFDFELYKKDFIILKTFFHVFKIKLYDNAN